MPPKVRFTREEIIRAALDITRESGPEALTARSLAARLDCSAKPIFGLFRSMDEVQQEVLKAGYQFYGEAIAGPWKAGSIPPTRPPAWPISTLPAGKSTWSACCSCGTAARRRSPGSWGTTPSRSWT